MVFVGKTNLKKIVVRGLGLGLLAVISFGPFTNCSQNPQNASLPQTAFLSPSEQSKAFETQFKGRVPSSFCHSSEGYGCMKRIYSAKVKSQEGPAKQECGVISNNLQLCPMTQVFQFNTEAAEENCSGCTEHYEYIEYACHLKIPNSENIYPMVAIKPTMDESLIALHQLCLTIATEPQ